MIGLGFQYTRPGCLGFLACSDESLTDRFCSVYYCVCPVRYRGKLYSGERRHRLSFISPCLEVGEGWGGNANGLGLTTYVQYTTDFITYTNDIAGLPG